MNLPQKVSLAGQISFYMRIILGGVTCRCLSVIWVLANAGGQGEGEGGGKQQQLFFFFNHRKVAQDSHSSFVEPIVCQADSTDSLLCKDREGKGCEKLWGMCEHLRGPGSGSGVKRRPTLAAWRSVPLSGALRLMYLKGLNTNPVLLQILKGALLCIIIKRFCNAGCCLLFNSITKRAKVPRPRLQFLQLSTCEYSTFSSLLFHLSIRLSRCPLQTRSPGSKILHVEIIGRDLLRGHKHLICSYIDFFKKGCSR